MNKIDVKREQATKDFLLDLALIEELGKCERTVVRSQGKSTAQVSPPNAYDPDVQVGQIRLMPDSAEIAYVAVVSRWDFSSYLVVPFSTFDGPATETELHLAGYDGGLSLNTVQVWNARTWHAQTLARSWLVGTLPEKDLADIRALWSYSLGGKKPSANVMARTALPITSVDDPRIDYKTRSLAVFVPVDQIDDEVEDVVLKPVFKEEKFVLAAGEKPEPVIRRSDCRIKGFKGNVRLVYNAEKKILDLKVYGQAGGLSKDLDDWMLVTYDGEELGRVAEGRLLRQGLEAFDGVCCLIDKIGKVHVLISQDLKR